MMVVVGDGGIWGQKIKVAQNSLKHILVLEFLKSDEIFEFSWVVTSKQATIQTQDTTVMG